MGDQDSCNYGGGSGGDAEDGFDGVFSMGMSRNCDDDRYLVAVVCVCREYGCGGAEIGDVCPGKAWHGGLLGGLKIHRKGWCS